MTAAAAEHLTGPLLDASYKGYPAWAPALHRTAVGQQGWNVLQADWPLPCAVLRQSALQHNLGWMQQLVRQAGVELAPHGKTTLSPELFRAQLDAGAWGITFATVGQLAMGVQAGVQRAIVANQVLLPHDLAWLRQLKATHAQLQAPFLLDSCEQLQAVERFTADRPGTCFDVLIELGLEGGRTGCRSHTDALALARRARASTAVRLVGLECYEGLWAKGDNDADATLVHQLMQRVHALALACDAEQLFEGPEVLLTAGGSAVFDLVAPALRQALGRPVVGLLRSGCYITHDHGFYKRLGALADQRLAKDGLAGQTWGCGNGLQAALEVWAVVQSCPEPGLAILNAGKRDLSFDMGLPTPVAWCPAGGRQPQAAPPSWSITGLNDQHAYLRIAPCDGGHPSLATGDRVALGISHPCTTFDKWRWMPVVDDAHAVVNAITTCF